MGRTGAVRAAAACVFVLLATAACADDTAPPRPVATGTPSPPPASPTAGTGPQLSPAEAALAQRALDAVEGLRHMELDLSAAPPPVAEAEQQLVQYVADPYLLQVLLALRALAEHGLIRTGALESQATVLEVGADESPREVVVRQCLDATGWELVESDTGQAPAQEPPAEIYAAQPDHYVRVLHVTEFEEDRWLIERAVWQEEPC